MAITSITMLKQEIPQVLIVRFKIYLKHWLVDFIQYFALESVINVHYMNFDENYSNFNTLANSRIRNIGTQFYFNSIYFPHVCKTVLCAMPIQLENQITIECI